MKYTADGRELPDSTPIEIPAGMRRPETVHQMLARMVRSSVSDMAASQGKETFEESFDFDVDDDDELPLTGHELVAMRLEIGKDGAGADADSGDGEDGEDGEGGSRSGVGRRNRSRQDQDDDGEDGGDFERRDRRRVADDDRGGKSRDSGASSRSKSRGGRVDREELDE